MSIIKPTTQSGVTPDTTDETISPFGAAIFAVAHAESKPRSPIVPASPPVQPASVPRNVLEVAAIPTASCPAAPAATHEGDSKEHSLSHELASRLGFPSALLLKYLAHRIAKSGKTHEGRRFIRVNLDHLTEVFPYLSRSCLADAVKTLPRDRSRPS